MADIADGEGSLESSSNAREKLQFIFKKIKDNKNKVINNFFIFILHFS